LSKADETIANGLRAVVTREFSQDALEAESK
jgi:hypothetical protein